MSQINWKGRFIHPLPHKYSIYSFRSWKLVERSFSSSRFAKNLIHFDSKTSQLNPISQFKKQKFSFNGIQQLSFSSFSYYAKSSRSMKGFLATLFLSIFTYNIANAEEKKEQEKNSFVNNNFFTFNLII